jgi:UDP-2,3-diacylglucosamine hydrolase
MSMHLNHLQPLFEWSSPTVFISDLHLNGGTRDVDVIKHLRGLLEPKPSSVKTKDQSAIERIVLLGDLFDFQLGYTQTIYRAHLPFYFFLQEAINSGVEIIVFTGNHDPDIHPMMTKELNIQVLTKPTLIQIYGSLARIEHGDLLEYHVLKRVLCRIVRYPIVCRLARLLPPHLMWMLTSQWGTKENTLGLYDDKPLLHMIEQSWPTHSEQGIDHWIFGHFHQALTWSNPSAHSISPSNPQVFVLGDQVNLHTYLQWDNLGPRLHKF